MKVIIICLSFTRTSQSRFCPRPVVRDSDTEHGPGDQGQFMGGNEHKCSFMELAGRGGSACGGAFPPGSRALPRVCGCAGLRRGLLGAEPWPNFKTPVWPCVSPGECSFPSQEHR